MGAHDLTDAVLASPAGTVVLGRSAGIAGSVWVVIDGDRFGRDGAAGAARLVCVHGPGTLPGQVRTEGPIRVGRMSSADWRIAPARDAVRGTPARLNG